MIYELVFAGALLFHPPVLTDSIGTETINGKVFVIHKVDEKETLYAIARRYGATVDAIRQSNPSLSDALEVGQILKVPYTRNSVTTANRNTTAAKNGTVHKVAAKETMFSISRQYGVSVDDIRKWNGLTDNSLSIGQELVIRPSVKESTTDNRTNNNNTPAPKALPANGTHTVAQGETLYSISRIYGVSVQQIKSLNNLTSEELQPGQALVLVKKESTAVVPRNNETTVSTNTRTSGGNGSDSSPVRQNNQGTETRRDPQPATENPAAQTIRISESMKNSDEIIEAGLAELIEGTEGNRKYLALHRTAPVGTILKVRNEMNNREVFVRVMGKINDTAMNEKVLIRLSRSAYDRLGAIDPRFRVEVTYYK